MNIPQQKVIFAIITFFYSLSATGQVAGVLCKTSVVHDAVDPAPFLFFENLGKKEGAPANIQKIYRDNKGYVWLCKQTGQGIVRFDGAKFFQVPNDPSNPASLPGSTVFDLLQDRTGRLWFSTNEGIVCYDADSEKPRRIPTVAPLHFGTFFEDSRGRIWVGTDGQGVQYYDPLRDSMVVFPGIGITNGYDGTFYPKNSFDKFSAFAETPDGLIWTCAVIYSKNGPPTCALVSLHPFKHDIRFYLAKELFKQKPIVELAPSFSHFYFDSARNCFWLGGHDTGLLCFSLSDHRWERFYFANNPDFSNDVLSIAPRNANQLWLGCGNGVKIFDIPQKRLYPVPPEKTGSDGLCIYLYTDQSGATWFANRNTLSRLAPYRQQFALQKSGPDKFPAEAMVEVPTTGELFFMSYDKKGIFKVLAVPTDGGNWRRHQQATGLRSETEGNVLAAQVASDGKIWVGLDGGVGWIDPQTLQLTIPKQPLLRDKEQQRSDQLWVSDLWPGKNGDMWMATWNAGIVQYDARNGQFICHTYQLGHSNKSLFNNAYRSVYQTPSEVLFMGGSGTGLEVWDPMTKDYRLCIHNPKNPNSISGMFVFCMEADKKGQLWLGTENGLCRYREGVPLDSAFESAQAPKVWIYDIKSDTNGRLWLKTAEGLVLYDPSTKQSTLFGEKQGMTLPFDEGRPLYADHLNTIWYGSGLHFNADSIRPAPLRASPRLTGLKIHDQPWTGEVPIGMATRIELAPAQNTLRFEMTALDFDCRPGESLFKVKFDKGEEDIQWTDLGPQNFATYANLPPGTYHFRFFAGNAESGWMPASDARHLTVVIHPYFYQTWWFRTLLAALLLGFVATATAFYYRYQLRAQQLQAEKQQREAERQRLELEKNAAVAEEQRKVAESEMKLLRSQLNPHFLFNAMNSINRYILSNEKDKASEYLGQFAQLTRSILDNSRSLTIPLADELKMLHHYLALENHRFQQNIHWTFTVSPDLDEEDVLVPSMFLQPFAENAILHGLAPKGGGHIAVEISQHDGGLQCVLRDDGVGRQSAAVPAEGKPRHASVGMRLIAERLHAFAGLQGQSAAFVLHDLKDEAGLPLGTEVVIRLPLVMAV